jgi:hypothetical protein
MGGIWFDYTKCSCERCKPYFIPCPLSPPMQTTIVKTPWQCPGCKTFYSPEVNKCECQRVIIQQGAT